MVASSLRHPEVIKDFLEMQMVLNMLFRRRCKPRKGQASYLYTGHVLKHMLSLPTSSCFKTLVKRNRLRNYVTDIKRHFRNHFLPKMFHVSCIHNKQSFSCLRE